MTAQQFVPVSGYVYKIYAVACCTTSPTCPAMKTNLLNITRSLLVERHAHLTKLEHLVENRAVFPYIKHLHLLHHLILQRFTGKGVTTSKYAQSSAKMDLIRQQQQPALYLVVWGDILKEINIVLRMKFGHVCC